MGSGVSRETRDGSQPTAPCRQRFDAIYQQRFALAMSMGLDPHPAALLGTIGAYRGVAEPFCDDPTLWREIAPLLSLPPEQARAALVHQLCEAPPASPRSASPRSASAAATRWLHVLFDGLHVLFNGVSALTAKLVAPPPRH